MSEPLETLESSLGVDPVLLTPPDDPSTSPSYLPESPTLTGGDDELSEDFSQDNVPPLQAAERSGDDSFPDEERLAPHTSPLSEDDGLTLEAAMEDEAAVLRSGRGEDFSELAGLDDESSETLHPIL
ncbi:hypothetical protein NEA10_18560 [Phormidium yuhuli AB48]|uniref:Uncharacterized protein n=1 Tax=Phormidium yuhuli AB48 TaxID=2940671 RepID=A0ABY5ARL6_9CYAN|nr:hypothetical protein [Phormidium yuhuli]USR90798.1 hypothetical protein NEA10_18560 [Phormidium yuhuli AB48]